MTIDELRKAAHAMRKVCKSPTFYQREAANRNAQRRAAFEELSTEMLVCWSILDDDKKMRRLRSAKPPSWYKPEQAGVRG